MTRTLAARVGTSMRRANAVKGTETHNAQKVTYTPLGAASEFISATAEAHLASWGGMCPGNDESAGMRRSGKTRRGSKSLSQTLVRMR
jgi:transposase